MTKLRFAASVLVLTAFAGGASAQEGTAAIDLRCSDIASLGEAHAAALVYYIAGYQDAQMAKPPNPPLPRKAKPLRQRAKPLRQRVKQPRRKARRRRSRWRPPGWSAA